MEKSQPLNHKRVTEMIQVVKDNQINYPGHVNTALDEAETYLTEVGIMDALGQFTDMGKNFIVKLYFKS